MLLHSLRSGVVNYCWIVELRLQPWLMTYRGFPLIGVPRGCEDPLCQYLRLPNNLLSSKPAAFLFSNFCMGNNQRSSACYVDHASQCRRCTQRDVNFLPLHAAGGKRRKDNAITMSTTDIRDSAHRLNVQQYRCLPFAIVSFQFSFRSRWKSLLVDGKCDAMLSTSTTRQLQDHGNAPPCKGKWLLL